MANPLSKARKTGNPYAVFRAGDMIWQILKTYKQPKSEAKDPYARWLVAAQSGATFGSWELGDTYAREVERYGTLVAADPVFLEAYGIRKEYLPTPADYLATV